MLINHDRHTNIQKHTYDKIWGKQPMTQLHSLTHEKFNVQIKSNHEKI